MKNQKILFITLAALGMGTAGWAKANMRTIAELATEAADEQKKADEIQNNFEAKIKQCSDKTRAAMEILVEKSFKETMKEQGQPIEEEINNLNVDDITKMMARIKFHQTHHKFRNQAIALEEQLIPILEKIFALLKPESYAKEIRPIIDEFKKEEVASTTEGAEPEPTAAMPTEESTATEKSSDVATAEEATTETENDMTEDSTEPEESSEEPEDNEEVALPA